MELEDRPGAKHTCRQTDRQRERSDREADRPGGRETDEQTDSWLLVSHGSGVCALVRLERGKERMMNVALSRLVWSPRDAARSTELPSPGGAGRSPLLLYITTLYNRQLLQSGELHLI